MTLDYNRLLQYESNVSKQLKYLDQIASKKYGIQQQYPQLFQNEDSLFTPDQVFDHQEHRYAVRETRVQHNINNGQENLDENEEGRQFFEKYLDSLDINQFLNLRGQSSKNSKIIHSKSNKNLESSLECTFKPSISKKSCQIASNLKPSFQRLTMPIRTVNQKAPYRPNQKQLQRKYSKQRIERLSKPRVLKTQPSENIQYRKIQTEKKYAIPKSNYLDVAARNQLWEEQKTLKLEKLRKQQEENRQKREAGTFVPKLTEYKGEKLANLSNFAKQGMANYFQRVNMAKSKNYSQNGKQNNNSYRRENSPYESNVSSRTAKQQKKTSETKKNQKVKYEEAVKQLHKKLMSLDI